MYVCVLNWQPHTYALWKWRYVCIYFVHMYAESTGKHLRAMEVCMYICIYVYTCVYVYMYAELIGQHLRAMETHVCNYVFVYGWMFICWVDQQALAHDTNGCVCMYVYICVCVCMDIHMLLWFARTCALWKWKWICIYVCVYVCMCADTQAFIYASYHEVVRLFMCVFVLIHV